MYELGAAGFAALSLFQPAPSEGCFGGGRSGNVLPTAAYRSGLRRLSPTSGLVGTRVTLTGTNLSGATGGRFNGTAATTFSVRTATSHQVNHSGWIEPLIREMNKNYTPACS